MIAFFLHPFFMHTGVLYNIHILQYIIYTSNITSGKEMRHVSEGDDTMPISSPLCLEKHSKQDLGRYEGKNHRGNREKGRGWSFSALCDVDRPMCIQREQKSCNEKDSNYRGWSWGFRPHSLRFAYI